MQLKRSLVLRKVGDEYIIVAPDQGMVDMSKVYTLNATAAFLWQALADKDFDQETVTNLLVERYEVRLDIARQDTAALLYYFRTQEMVTE